jgi:hypothetical protein
VLTADQPPSTYLFRAAGLFDCAKLKAHSVARLHYAGTALEPATPLKVGDYDTAANVPGVQLNPLNYAPTPDSSPGDIKKDLVPISMVEGIFVECENEGGFFLRY